MNNIGTALMNQQLLDAAAKEFDQASHLDPELAAPLVNRGIALLYLQKTDEARAALLHAAQIAPDDAHVWYSLGLLYRVTNEWKPGMDSFRRAASIDPRNADVHYFIASMDLETGDIDAAIAEYRTALAINPLHASAEFGLARAFQRKGHTAAAREAFSKFQQMTEERLASPITHTYGEEGSLGRVENSPSGSNTAGAMIPLHFEAGVVSDAEQADPTFISAARPSKSCLIDLEGRGSLSLIEMTAGPTALKVFRAERRNDREELHSVPAELFGLALHGQGIACAAGDFDNDGLMDLAVALTDRIVLFRNLGEGKFQDVTNTSAIRTTSHPTGLLWVDFDHDGDLDLFITGRSTESTANALWRNNGNKTFTEQTQQTGLGGSKPTSASMLSDLNNDRAVDLLVTGDAASPMLYLNPREGLFTALPLYAQHFPPTTGVAVFDYNKDGWMDVAVTHAGSPGVTLWRNLDGSHFSQLLLPDLHATRAWGISSLDFDNDGWLDLAVGIDTPKGPAIRVLRNEGEGRFVDVSQDLGLDRIQLRRPTGLTAVDLAGTGAEDLLVDQADGTPVWLRNVGGNRNHSMHIALRGLADNKSGIGTKVEIFANGLWQKWEITSPTGILAGTGKAQSADVVRMLWPTGVPQDEINVADAKPGTFAELDRRGSSCPTLFAWNGHDYHFVSDVIGAGVVGHWTGPHQRNIPDPDEWIKVDGSALKSRDGSMSLRFGEPMEEVNYLDQVRLVAIDHPAGTNVFPNERFLSEPPFAKARSIITSKAHPLAGAIDANGRNVLDLLRKQDHDYVRDFKNLPYAGFANLHTLTLDLGPVYSQRPLRLLMHGFIEYFSASSMYAAWQAGIKPIPPYLDAEMPDGSWKRIIDDMGFPAGLPRTMVVDLTGKLPRGAHRIRITTNLQIYWDQALIDNSFSPGNAQSTELPLTSAELAFRGYPEQEDGKTPGDLTYDYQRKSLTGPFLPQTGAYTRYGVVTPLLKTIDDEYVIFGTGEDIDLEFSTHALRSLRPGWKRDYFFYANGYVKDMDFYDSDPFTVASLPFHAMSGYPYHKKEHYPLDAKHLEYQLEWNTRFQSPAVPRNYLLHYVPILSWPISPGTHLKQ